MHPKHMRRGLRFTTVQHKVAHAILSTLFVFLLGLVWMAVVVIIPALTR